MKKNKVTVIIPTYNRAYIISKSIESVLNQTYDNIELIIVDDGSSDNTEEVVNSFNDDRIKYYKLKKNGGTAVARNYGIDKATGEYIAFQDSDDIFRPNKIELQMDNLIKNKSVMDFCKICIHEGENIYYVPTKEEDKQLKKISLVDKLCQNNVVSTQSILIKTSIVKNYGFDPDIPNTDDYDLALRVAIDNKVSYTQEALVDLYRQTDSITYSKEKSQKSAISMLRKNYKLSDEQIKILYDYLIFLLTNPSIMTYQKRVDELNRNIEENQNIIEELKNQNNLLNVEIAKQQDLLNSKTKENDELKKMVKHQKDDYQKIVNSKWWRLRKIFLFWKK